MVQPPVVQQPLLDQPPLWPQCEPSAVGQLPANPQPRLGSPELPTRGSAMHHFGDCKPCAYAFHKGCSNGVECQFCHLCPPGELKRRQKVKRSSQRMQQATLRSE